MSTYYIFVKASIRDKIHSWTCFLMVTFRLLISYSTPRTRISMV